jgi:hypothetical protein
MVEELDRATKSKSRGVGSLTYTSGTAPYFIPSENKKTQIKFFKPELEVLAQNPDNDSLSEQRQSFHHFFNQAVA